MDEEVSLEWHPSYNTPILKPLQMRAEQPASMADDLLLDDSWNPDATADSAQVASCKSSFCRIQQGCGHCIISLIAHVQFVFAQNTSSLNFCQIFTVKAPSIVWPANTRDLSVDSPIRITIS